MTTFLAIQNTDKHLTVSQKLEDAIAHYTARRGHAPTLALVSHADAAALADASWRGQGEHDLTIESADFLRRGHFYLAAGTWEQARMGAVG